MCPPVNTYLADDYGEVLRAKKGAMSSARMLTVSFGLALTTLTTMAILVLGGSPNASGESTMSTKYCQGSSLVGTVVAINVGAGNTLTTIAITNVGESTCRLGGYPLLSGVRSGREYPVRIAGHVTQDIDLHSTDLGPRMSGALILDAAVGCVSNGDPSRAAHTYSGIEIKLPKQRGSVSVLGKSLYVPCNIAVSELGWATGFQYQ
jgi:hypothetical protein